MLWADVKLNHTSPELLQHKHTTRINSKTIMWKTQKYKYRACRNTDDLFSKVCNSCMWWQEAMPNIRCKTSICISPQLCILCTSSVKQYYTVHKNLPFTCPVLRRAGFHPNRVISLSNCSYTMIWGVRLMCRILTELKFLCANAVKNTHSKIRIHLSHVPEFHGLETENLPLNSSTSIWLISHSRELCNKNCTLKNLISWSFEARSLR